MLFDTHVYLNVVTCLQFKVFISSGIKEYIIENLYEWLYGDKRQSPIYGTLQYNLHNHNMVHIKKYISC